MDAAEYAELFQAEAGEYMQVLNQCLLNLEKQPCDRENLLEAFRAVHSLKGMAGTMGYQQVTDIAHCLENFLEDLKAALFEPSAEVLDLVFQAVDYLQLSLANPEKSLPRDRKKVEQLLTRIRSFQSSLTAGQPKNRDQEEQLQSIVGETEREIIRQARDKGHSPYLIEVVLRRDTVMKSVRAYMVLRVLEELGEVVFTVPPQPDLEEERFEYGFQVGLILHGGNPEQVENMLLKIGDVEQVTVSPWEEAANFQQEPVSPQPETDTVETEEVPSKVAQAMRAVDKMVRVETQKLDELVNLVGEMVVTRTRIGEIGRGYSEDLDNTIDQLKRAITNLQDTAMKLRMVPIKQVFDRFPRMVRDLSRDSQKQIRFLISGENTELDRSIINQLSDPLVHLLRNAVDHGIESPDSRVAAGKDPVGSVILKAFHEGNQVVIIVEDDGAGIDPRKVTQRALERGLISEAERGRMIEEDASQLIFKSGFSTAEQITEISGRGVGMDVVKKSIEALHGTIEVQSKTGAMTRFILRLPLTLAIIKSLMVRSAGQIYAIPIELVRENVYLESSEIKTINGHLVVNMRNEVIPLYFLDELLGFDREKGKRDEYSVVIAEAGSKTTGLIVDELVGQQEIMIKSIGQYFQGLKGIAGATILGDGSVTLIIDVVGLFDNGRVYIEQNRISC
ncbi:MAG: chemotaxis protein CheA [Bacillota bacterium]